MNELIEVKVGDLTGAALDWAVAKAAGWVAARIVPILTPSKTYYEIQAPSGLQLNPSVDWARCGPLIEKYQVAPIPEAHDGLEGTEMSERWYADIYYDGGEQYTTEHCDSPLIAACRAIVASVFGDTVNIPVELI
ncbi:phage protein NinX family protein [Pseudomonas sp. SMN5]|uniref:phage protein NinX family protein n=1 Tax=Pseudomonas sp. SMN5 TaxID=3390198 RepID=UPI003F82D5DA